MFFTARSAALEILRDLIVRVHSGSGVYAVATARRLPEQVDRAGSIARVPRSRKLEEDRDLHINTVTRAEREPRNPPIVTGGVEIRRMACSLSSRSNGGAPKGAVSATWLSAKSTCTVAPDGIIVLWALSCIMVLWPFGEGCIMVLWYYSQYHPLRKSGIKKTRHGFLRKN